MPNSLPAYRFAMALVAVLENCVLRHPARGNVVDESASGAADRWVNRRWGLVAGRLAVRRQEPDFPELGCAVVATVPHYGNRCHQSHWSFVAERAICPAWNREAPAAGRIRMHSPDRAKQ